MLLHSILKPMVYFVLILIYDFPSFMSFLIAMVQVLVRYNVVKLAKESLYEDKVS